MVVELRLPDLGDGVEDADVIAVLVASGDTVAVEQGLIEIETDKASVEVPAEQAGRIVELRVATGDVIRPGDVIATLEAVAAGDAPDDAAPDDAGASAEAPANDAPDDAVPDDAAPDDAAPDDDGASAADAPVEKASAEGDAPAEADGSAETDASGPPEPEAEPAPEREPAPAAAAPRSRSGGETAGPGVPTGSAEATDPAVAAAPSVRAFARQIGVDIRAVPGSGPGGRIDVEDVKRYARRRAQELEARPVAAAPAAPLPDLSQWGPVERERMSRTRRATMRTLGRSWSQSPHVTIQHTANVTELEEQRHALRAEVEAAGGGKLTLLPILVKVAAELLHQHPVLHAAIDEETQEIVYRRYYHIGVAVDTPRGLLVPVVRDADRKTITEISGELAELGERARSGDLSMEEMAGASFTLTNLGAFGTGFFTPLLNPPEVAILGVGRSVERAVFEDGQVVPRLELPLSLSFDHRLVDGADGARFMQAYVRALEDPLRIVL